MLDLTSETQLTFLYEKLITGNNLQTIYTTPTIV